MLQQDTLRTNANEQSGALANTQPRPWHNQLLSLAPNLFGRISKLYEASHGVGSISAKLRHLIWVAVDAVPTHLYPAGIELHAKAALEHGASVSEIIEALEIASTIGERTFKLALPIVLDEMRSAGIDPTNAELPLNDQAQAVKDQFIARDGVLPQWLDQALRLSHHYVGALLALGHARAEAGALDPKSREFLFLAVHSCPATLDAEAIRRHAKRCLELGATAEELIEVLQYTSGIGIHAFSMGAAGVMNAIEKAKG